MSAGRPPSSAATPPPASPARSSSSMPATTSWASPSKRADAMTSAAPPNSPPAAPRLVPYDRARHGDQPWQVVSAVWAEYGFVFERTEYEDDLIDPATHYGGGRGWFMVAEDAE